MDLFKAHLKEVLWHAFLDHVPDVNVQCTHGAKLTTTVFSNARFGKGELTLVPLTFNIGIGTKVPANGLALKHS
eukprot:8127088-Pyramimonas_sp.AAC.1